MDKLVKEVTKVQLCIFKIYLLSQIVLLYSIIQRQLGTQGKVEAATSSHNHGSVVASTFFVPPSSTRSALRTVALINLTELHHCFCSNLVCTYRRTKQNNPTLKEC